MGGAKGEAVSGAAAPRSSSGRGKGVGAATLGAASWPWRQEQHRGRVVESSGGGRPILGFFSIIFSNEGNGIS